MATAVCKDQAIEPLYHIAKFNAAYARAPDPMKKKYQRQHAIINKARRTIKKLQRAQTKSPAERSDYIKGLFMQSKPLENEPQNNQLPSYLTSSTASAPSSTKPSQPTEEQQRKLREEAQMLRMAGDFAKEQAAQIEAESTLLVHRQEVDHL